MKGTTSSIFYSRKNSKFKLCDFSFKVLALETKTHKNGGMCKRRGEATQPADRDHLSESLSGPSNFLVWVDR